VGPGVIEATKAKRTKGKKVSMGQLGSD